MKQSYEITIKPHQNSYKGIVTKGVIRDYFEPAFSGQAFAHDIIEHPIVPHPNPYIDEIMALGAFASGRVSSGWCNRSFFSTETVRPSAVKVPIGDMIKHDYLRGDCTMTSSPDLFISDANAAYLYSDGSQRYGQFMVNQLRQNHPDIYVRMPQEADCFFDNSLIPQFLQFVYNSAA